MSELQKILTKLEEDRKKANKRRYPNNEEINAQFLRMAKLGYVSDYDKGAYEKLAKWMAAKKLGFARKGLFLWGATGTGKTYFFQCHFNIKTFTSSEVVDTWKECNFGHAFEERLYDAYYGTKTTVKPKAVIIDDLGQEPLGVCFGERLEVMERVICDRYRNWQDGSNTYFTSNLNLEELRGRYGDRVMDRLAEMCYFVEFTGVSARSGDLFYNLADDKNEKVG